MPVACNYAQGDRSASLILLQAGNLLKKNGRRPTIATAADAINKLAATR